MHTCFEDCLTVCLAAIESHFGFDFVSAFHRIYSMRVCV